MSMEAWASRPLSFWPRVFGNVRYDRRVPMTFVKYHGLGNDFVVLDRRAEPHDIDPATVIRLCDRHRGIGADGVLTILSGHGGTAQMVVHNADGSIAEMCGNGLRCVVKYLAETAAYRPEALAVMTGAGLLESAIAYDPTGLVTSVTVAMGPAKLVAPTLPNGGPFVRQRLEGFDELLVTAVSMGNPHCVVLNALPSDAAHLGPALEHHPLFTARTNVEFVRTRTKSEGYGLEVTVWERGVGLTLACGTGACAAVVAAILDERCEADTWVPVKLPGGLLEINVKAGLSEVWLRGPVEKVFEGRAP